MARDSETDEKEKYEASSRVVDVDEVAQNGGGEFPDGGPRAWLIVVGAMCVTFSTFGYVNSWGIFQNYYTKNILSKSSPSSISWIGSIQYSLVFLPALVSGRLFDIGYFHTIFLGSSALLIIATFVIPQCTQYWHFLLCQGILVGLGCGGMYGPTTAVVAHWFKRRLGFAMGIVAVGSSLGGTVLPIVARNLIPRVGFHWTLRIFGFIFIVTLGTANLLLKRRLPPKNVAGGLLNLRAFKSVPYSVFCASSFVVFLGLYTVLTYVGVSAISIGIPSDFAFYFIAIANASSLFGRFTAGSLADRYGNMNVMIPLTAWAGILTYAWPFAKTKASLIALTVLYGFGSGSYVSLLTNPIIKMGSTDDAGRRTGMFMSILALGALSGPPISGAISTSNGGFKAVGYYAGSVVLLGVGLICVSRYFILGRRMWGKI